MPDTQCGELQSLDAAITKLQADSAVGDWLTLRGAQPQVRGYDDLMTQIAAASRRLSQYEFIDETDRQLAKKVRAAINKWLADVKRSAKAELHDYTHTYTRQLADIQDAVAGLTLTLDNELKRFDQAFRDQRRREIRAEYNLRFQDAASSLDDSLTADALWALMFEASWLNRSGHVGAISRDIADRFESIIALVTDKQLLLDLSAAAQLLSRNGWSFREARRQRVDQLDAERLLNETATRTDAPGEQPAVDAERIDRVDTAKPLLYVTLGLPADQVGMLRAIAESRGWSVKVN